MGLGDEIMAAAQARAMWRQLGKRVRILDRIGRVRAHEIWQGLPYIMLPTDPPGDSGALVNGPRARPYIVSYSLDRFVWRAFGPPRGELALSDHERAWARRQLAALQLEPGRFLVIEPLLKPGATSNKDWGFGRWQEAAAALARSTRLVQLGPPGARRLDGVLAIETPAARLAFAVLALSGGYLGHEGAMHHAAAALGIPAVVIFGGFISPAVTGYPGQHAFFTPTPEWPLGCGFRRPCSHCASAMASVRVPAIVAAALGLPTVGVEENVS